MKRSINLSSSTASLIFITVLLIFTSCLAASDTTPIIPPAQPPPADITAPRILDVSVVVSENNSVIVRWNTEEESTSEARLYDITSNAEVQAAIDNQYIQQHVLIIDGNMLKADTTYSMTLISTDRAGNTETRYNARMLSVNILAAQNPVYRIFTLPSLDGAQVSLTDFKGKQVLLHFWMFGCHVCEEELPLFDALYRSLPQNELPMLVICLNAEAQQVRDYLANHKLALPVLVDQPGTAGIAYGVKTYPSTYIVEADGSIVRKKENKFEYVNDIREFMGLRSYFLSY